MESENDKGQNTEKSYAHSTLAEVPVGEASVLVLSTENAMASGPVQNNRWKIRSIVCLTIAVLLGLVSGILIVKVSTADLSILVTLLIVAPELVLLLLPLVVVNIVIVALSMSSIIRGRHQISQATATRFWMSAVIAVGSMVSLWWFL